MCLCMCVMCNYVPTTQREERGDEKVTGTKAERKGYARRDLEVLRIFLHIIDSAYSLVRFLAFPTPVLSIDVYGYLFVIGSLFLQSISKTTASLQPALPPEYL